MTNRTSPKSCVAIIAVALLLGTASSHAATVIGTGFAVTSDGIVITNNHVISECESPIKARIEGNSEYYYLATVLARDAGHDLAALKLLRRVGQNIQGLPAIQRAIFRKGPAVQQGDKAIAYGFPLRGLLATTGNLTVGYVSALSGLGDDRNYLQITTPIQQGNSGGPLYDGNGHVIGVVVAKLNALGVMLATGDVPQNVNFAVAIHAVRQFLTQNNIQVGEADSTTELPLPEVGQRARLSTYLIECEIQEATTAGPSPLALPPSSGPPTLSAQSQQSIPVGLSKLKLSDIRRPYPTLYPHVFEISVSNAGQDPVSELTIAFGRTQRRQCSQNLDEYDGFKRFNVNLVSGDSITVSGEFSATAVSFCIVKAFGPPVGLAACSNSNVVGDVAITACTSAIQSGEVQGVSRIAAYVGRGGRYDDKGEYDRAIADYTEASRLGPKSDNAFSQYAWYVFFKRGWDYAKINDYDRAIADCSEAVRLNSRSEGALFIRAYSSVRKGDYEQGISDYTAVIRLNAKIGGAFRGRASLYFQKGEFDLAIADYTEAIKLEPAIAASHSRRGYAYQAKGDYDQAIADYDEAIRINPSYTNAYNNRGFAYFSKGDMPRAILDYNGAIRLDEEYALSYRNRGIAELYSGSPTKGLDDLDLAIQLKPSDLYASLWREIAAWQANAPSTLGQAASKIDTTAWPAPIIRVYLGESSPADLIALTTSAASQRSDGRLCEANFYGGQLALHRGSKEEAKRALQAAAADCPRQFIEAGAAAADLRALGH